MSQTNFWGCRGRPTAIIGRNDVGVFLDEHDLVRWILNGARPEWQVIDARITSEERTRAMVIRERSRRSSCRGGNVITVYRVAVEVRNLSRQRVGNALQNIFVGRTAKEIGIDTAKVAGSGTIANVSPGGISNSGINSIPIKPVFNYRLSWKFRGSGRKNVFVVVHVKVKREANLLKVVNATSVPRLLFGSG